MSSLYEQVNFILSGGALRMLVEFLTPRVDAAIIASPKNDDLEIVDAVGITTAGLFLHGWASKVGSAFPERAKGEKFEVQSARLEGNWPWALRICGPQWAFYVLLRQAPSEAMLAELPPIAGLIALWQAFQRIDVTEERLARMTYMILATKNTLASIFEPMPLNYYTSFLVGVLKESLFPCSLSVFKDDGSAISLMEGSDPVPARDGIYAKAMLPPVPVVVEPKGSEPYEIILPITNAMESYRLFCLAKVEMAPEKETLDFLELVITLASRALSINSLENENKTEKARVSSEEFTVLSLSKTLNALKSSKDRSGVLSMALDIFSELAQAGECLLVTRNGNGYAPVEYRKDSIKTSFNASVLASDVVTASDEPLFFDLAEKKFSALLKCPWPEMNAMKLLFPIWVQGRMEAFIAVSSSGASALPGNDRLPALGIVAQFTAVVMKNFARE